MELTTQRGYVLYEVASALQKSIRRGDVRLAGFMALELFPRYAEYCWKRLLTVSAEDCHGIITKEIKALYDSFWVINKGQRGDDLKGRIFISKAVIILCTCGHSRDADILSNYIYDQKALLSDAEIEALMDEVRAEGRVDLPDYVYDVHTRKGKARGKTKEAFFREEEAALCNKQQSLFEGIV
jgi:replication-associated recombination protein RarA